MLSNRDTISRVAVEVILAVALTTNAAAAAPPDPTEATIEEGVKLRTQGRHVEALELFEKAHAERPSARTLAQMGLAEGSLKRWLAAENHLAAALAAHDTPWIENQHNRRALEQALLAVRGHIGAVKVVGPAGAEVSVDGRVVGRLPLDAPLRVAEGSTTVRGFALGHSPVIVEATVTGGAETTVVLDLGLTRSPPFQEAPIIGDGSPTAPPPRGWRSWTGASLLALSATALISGGIGIALDGRGTCDAVPGLQCQQVYDTRMKGWLALGVGAAAGLGSGLLLWQPTN